MSVRVRDVPSCGSLSSQLLREQVQTRISSSRTIFSLELGIFSSVQLSHSPHILGNQHSWLVPTSSYGGPVQGNVYNVQVDFSVKMQV